MLDKSIIKDLIPKNFRQRKFFEIYIYYIFRKYVFSSNFHFLVYFADCGRRKITDFRDIDHFGLPKPFGLFCGFQKTENCSFSCFLRIFKIRTFWLISRIMESPKFTIFVILDYFGFSKKSCLNIYSRKNKYGFAFFYHSRRKPESIEKYLKRSSSLFFVFYFLMSQYKDSNELSISHGWKCMNQCTK